MSFFKQSRKYGTLLLCVWLIASGVMSLIPQLSFPHDAQVLSVLAIAAGVLILIDR